MIEEIPRLIENIRLALWHLGLQERTRITIKCQTNSDKQMKI